MELLVLGPLAIRRHGQDIPVSSPKLRAALACLVVHADELVTADALIDVVWEGQPPASATNTLQTYISQLRHLLEPDHAPGTEWRALRTLPGGYQLGAEPERIDHVRFEESLRDGRGALQAGDPVKAADLLRDGLARWRGPAYANVGGAAARSEAARLDDLRLVALHLRLEADLECGRHAEVVGELDRLVHDEPWREPFIGQLMLALYRCGRQADALARYREARRRHADELAIEPGPELQDLERRILRQDPGLATAAPPVPPASATHRRRRRRWAALAGGLATAAALAGLFAFGRAGDDPPLAARPLGVFNEFDLAVHPGVGYDLDIPPGRPSDWHATNNPRSPDYDFLDLYRTSVRAPAAENQISGVDLRNTNDFNAIHMVADTDRATICTRLPQRGGGNVKMRALHAGARVCVHTRESRWAMLAVTRPPADREAVLLLHVTVLTS
ncbi:BTAD domain-containing putative transcriptional regulator [Actinoplanes sp. NPDC049265]|uniref:AfsR/SARP family transcriptional regulator n=1 Tax=Actinoplanes sp. NPDC049265 TaxID=3363902 RepID=UPI003718B757